jgi:hypothetical protein
MATDAALIEKREELKHRLVAGEYKTLVDIFLVWFERVLRKVTHRTKPLPLWLVTVVLCILVSSIIYPVIYIAGDWSAMLKIGESLGLEYRIGMLFAISTLILSIIVIIVINQYIGRLLALWRDGILDKTESIISLNDFEAWLKITCNWRLQLFVTIIMLILFVPSFLATNTLFGANIGYGILCAMIVQNMFVNIMLYQLLMVMLLSTRLRRYDLKLFSADPGSTELTSRLSGELGFFIYFIAIYAAILTLVSSQTGILSSFGFYFVLLFWLPIIALFILNQTSLSSIIRRAKWKTLNEIQARVEKLQETENYSDKETMEAINRLMNYHNEVKATRNSAVDLGTALNFINSLLLPLIAFILGNLDLVTSLFIKKP